jgi:hypothetical protein
MKIASDIPSKPAPQSNDNSREIDKEFSNEELYLDILKDEDEYEEYAEPFVVNIPVEWDEF